VEARLGGCHSGGEVTAMSTCWCGRTVRWFEAWTCQSCGAPCCPSCSYTPEGTAYCAACAALGELEAELAVLPEAS
jgi:hypothetical protein